MKIILGNPHWFEFQFSLAGLRRNLHRQTNTLSQKDPQPAAAQPVISGRLAPISPAVLISFLVPGKRRVRQGAGRSHSLFELR